MKISLAGKELAVEVGGWNWKGMAFFVEDGEDRGRGGEKIQGRGRDVNWRRQWRPWPERQGEGHISLFQPRRFFFLFPFLREYPNNFVRIAQIRSQLYIK